MNAHNVFCTLLFLVGPPAHTEGAAAHTTAAEVITQIAALSRNGPAFLHDPITEEGVSIAIRKLAPSKALRPDGMPPESYKHAGAPLAEAQSAVYMHLAQTKVAYPRSGDMATTRAFTRKATHSAAATTGASPCF